jgi:hypothetical protein
MAERQDLMITVDEEGRVRIEVKGVKGPGCASLLDELSLEDLGELLEAQRTREYHEQPAGATTRTKVRRR